MTEPRARCKEAEFPAAIPAERDRLVALLKQIAEQIDAAPLDRLGDALPILAAPAAELAQAAEDILGDGIDADPICVPGKGPNPCC